MNLFKKSQQNLKSSKQFYLIFTIFLILACQISLFNCSGFSKGSSQQITINLGSTPFVFSVTVDQYSAFVIRGAAGSATGQLTAQAQQTPGSGTGIASSSIAYSSGSQYGIVFSLIVSMNNGQVSAVVFDDNYLKAADCQSFCPTSPCSGVPSFTGGQCYFSCGSNMTVCDPRIYVSWNGTDVSGNTLSSNELSIGRFKQYSFASLLASAKGLAQNLKNKARRMLFD